MTKLILVRGLPGSGKSTYARELERSNLNLIHLEADEFFVDLDDEYKFDIKLLGAAHEWCYGVTVRALRAGHDVAVSNTFTRLWELEKYLAIPTLLPDVTLEIVEMKTQYGSVHDVPAEKIKQMTERWQEIVTSSDIPVTRIWK